MNHVSQYHTTQKMDWLGVEARKQGFYCQSHKKNTKQVNFESHISRYASTYSHKEQRRLWQNTKDGLTPKHTNHKCKIRELSMS